MAGVILNKQGPGLGSQLIAAALGQLGTGLIGDMFQRTADARGLKNAQALAQQKFDQEQQAAAIQRAQRMEDDAWIQQNMQWDRANPGQSMNNMARMINLNPELKNAVDQYQHVYPAMELSNTNLGDRNLQASYDPGTGAMQQAVQSFGIDPTREMVANTAANAAVKSAGISAGASRYATDQRRQAANMQNAIAQAQLAQKTGAAPGGISIKDAISAAGEFGDMAMMSDNPGKYLDMQDNAAAIIDKLLRGNAVQDTGEPSPSGGTYTTAPEAGGDFSGGNPESTLNKQLTEAEYQQLRQQFTDEQIMAEGFTLPSTTNMFSPGGIFSGQ